MAVTKITILKVERGIYMTDFAVQIGIDLVQNDSSSD